MDKEGIQQLNFLKWSFILIACFALGFMAVSVYGVYYTSTNEPKEAPKIESPILEADKKTEDIVKESNPSIVKLEVVGNFGKGGSGSGFIVEPSGKIVTNYQVIDNAQKAIVILQDGAKYNATKIINYSKDRDIAVLKIDASNLPAIKLGDSSKIEDGQSVIAIGSPLGLENSVTNGLISKKNLVIENNNYIQTSAPISPGSSGGVLMNYKGEVVGMTVATLRGGQNLNLAIPVNEIKPYLTEKVDISLSELNKPFSPSNTIHPEIPATKPPRMGWSRYANQRFGFSIEYPSDFIKGPAPQNGDGMTFYNKTAVLTVSAYYNYSNKGINELYDYYKSYMSGNITYSPIGGTWFVISSDNNGKLIYQKIILNEDVVNQFTFVFPKNQKDYYVPIVDHLESTFRSGNGK
ncbi:MAG: trypsin-like peptidase domain-containing protein [Desulfotomaculaceae bacterium]|nr:trypsin-like peptidase domain-containing protein [Desulfotomaculaceae bacterium]